MKMRYGFILCLGAIIGGYIAHVATQSPHVAAADPKTSKIDRLEITDPAGKVTVVIHSDPKPTVEVTDDKGKSTKMDLVDLARLSRRFGERQE